MVEYPPGGSFLGLEERKLTRFAAEFHWPSIPKFSRRETL